MSKAKVTFKANPARPANKGGKRYLIQAKGPAIRSYGGKPTLKVVPEKWAEDGDTVEVEKWQADILCSRYPDLFALKTTASASARATSKAAKAEEGEAAQDDPEPDAGSDL